MDKKSEQEWFVYILKCRDERLYTGITNNLSARLEAHNNGTGAKFTKGRAPVLLLYRETCASRSEATKRELAIKKLSRAQKMAIIALAS